jgi:hypothetical protein
VLEAVAEIGEPEADENGSPVIFEYKRSVNENVINQGLFYLNWLLDHRAGDVDQRDGNCGRR